MNALTESMTDSYTDTLNKFFRGGDDNEPPRMPRLQSVGTMSYAWFGSALYADDLRPIAPTRSLPELRYYREDDDVEHDYQRHHQRFYGSHLLFFGELIIARMYRKPHPKIVFNSTARTFLGIQRIGFNVLLKVLATEFPQVKVTHE